MILRHRRSPASPPRRPKCSRRTPRRGFKTVAPSATLSHAGSAASRSRRVFKTKGFSRLARRRGIPDDELCKAIHEVMLGQGDDLGGGIWKKRLGQNRHRSIILAKGGMRWIYEFVFSKQDQANITSAELAGFRKLAVIYESLDEAMVSALLNDGHWMEICDEAKGEVRE